MTVWVSHGTFVCFTVGFQLLRLHWDVIVISMFLGFVSGTSRLESRLLLCEVCSCMQTKSLQACVTLKVSYVTLIPASPSFSSIFVQISQLHHLMQGYMGLLRFVLPPFFFRKFLNTAAVNCGPLSDTTSSGKSYATNNVRNMLQVLSAVVLFISNVSNHFK